MTNAIDTLPNDMDGLRALILAERAAHVTERNVIIGKRCPDPTFRAGSGGGLMPAHERSI